MKILYYSPHPNLNIGSPSGPGTHMREVIAAFERQQHQVIRLIMGGEDPGPQTGIAFDNPWYKRLMKYLIPEIIWQTVKDISLLRHDRHSGKKLKELIEKEKPDLIYERGYYLMKSGTRCAKDCSIPHILELNAPYPEEKISFEGNSLFLKRSHYVEHIQVAGADKIVVVSSALKSYFSNKYPRCTQKLIVTPNAINPSHALSDPAGIKNIREKTGISSDLQVIGFVGSIFRYHGVDRLLNAFRKLVKEDGRQNVRLVIVGDGIVLPELKQYAHQAGISDRVHFIGNVNHREVYNYISLMDIAVMANSNWYGSPVKVFEYGAMKKAIVAPDNIPLRDVMRDQEDGLLVGNDDHDVYRALKVLLDEPAKRSVLANSFHHKVMTKHTWDQVVVDILDNIRDKMRDRSMAQHIVPGWKKRVLALRTDFAHHGDHSGYKQLLRYTSPVYTLGLTEGEEDLISAPKRKYQWLFEFDIWKYRRSIDLIHVMYAEDYLRFSPFLYRHIPVIATFHQPPETLEIEITSGKTRGQVGQYTHWLTKKRFSRLAAAIVTEENQKHILSRVMDPSKIHVIPLGVHLHHFQLAYRQFSEENILSDQYAIITVGNWLRDWEFYLEFMNHCSLVKPLWKFHLVNRRLDYHIEEKLAALPNVIHYADLSDHELKRLLYTCRVQFLPVISASGNNALMEGLAMGCPAVLTNVVSKNFPLLSESVQLYKKGDLQDALQKLETVLTLGYQDYLALKESTFARSLAYDWKGIAQRTIAIYQSVFK